MTNTEQNVIENGLNHLNGVDECDVQLINNCESIANQIGCDNWGEEELLLNEDSEPFTSYDYLQDVMDFRYKINSDFELLEVQLLVAFGGPNIWVHLCNDGTGRVEGYWWGSRATSRIHSDPMGIFEACEELFEMRRDAL